MRFILLWKWMKFKKQANHGVLAVFLEMQMAAWMLKQALLRRMGSPWKYTAAVLNFRILYRYIPFIVLQNALSSTWQSYKYTLKYALTRIALSFAWSTGTEKHQFKKRASRQKKKNLTFCCLSHQHSLFESRRGHLEIYPCLRDHLNQRANGQMTARNIIPSIPHHSIRTEEVSRKRSETSSRKNTEKPSSLLEKAPWLEKTLLKGGTSNLQSLQSPCFSSRLLNSHFAGIICSC